MKTKRIDNKKLKVYLLIITLWLLIFLFVSYGYASFTSSLDINATALMDFTTLNENFDITDMGVNGSSGASSVTLSRMGKEVKGSVYSDVCGGYVIYNFVLMNKTPYLAYISNINVKSLTNAEGNPTTGFDIEMINVTPNVDYLEGYESRIIQVKITNNCTTSDTLANFIFEFEFNLVKYYTYTLTTNVSDADINVTTSRGKTYTGKGSLTANIYEGDTINYSVSKTSYFPQSGSLVMPGSNKTTNITLVEGRTITITVTPSDQEIHFVNRTTGEYYYHGTNTVTKMVPLGDTVACSVGDGSQEYYYYIRDDGLYWYYYEEWTVTDNRTINVTLKEKPYISGSYSNTDRTTAATGTLTNYHPGYYLVEIWGGHGGKGSRGSSSLYPSAEGGSAGYVYGVIHLNYEDALYYTLGGNGYDIPNGQYKVGAEASANGGAATSGPYTNHGGGGGGGGYSALRYTSSSGNVIMVAGGGGGGSGRAGISGGYLGSVGGNGGSYSTTVSSISGYYVYSGTDGVARSGQYYGTGGSTTYGLCPAMSTGYSSQWQGGYGENGGGGGGGGYYGGGGGNRKDSSTTEGIGGGGGGSSMISTSVSTSVPSGSSLTGSNPSSTGGGLIITYIGKTLSS